MKHKYLKIGATVLIVALVLTLIFVKVREGATVNKDENGSGVQISEEDEEKRQYQDVDLEEPNSSETNGNETDGNKSDGTSQGTTNSSQQGNYSSGSNDSTQDNSSQENTGQEEPNPEEDEDPLSNGTVELPTDVFQ